jgi:hypothetical protein
MVTSETLVTIYTALHPRRYESKYSALIMRFSHLHLEYYQYEMEIFGGFAVKESGR